MCVCYLLFFGLSSCVVGGCLLWIWCVMVVVGCCRCLLLDVYYLLFVDCRCVSFVVYCLSFVVCRLLFVDCCVLFVKYGFLYVFLSCVLLCVD